MTRAAVPATVYLLHFDRPYRHARHYIGYTALESVEARIARHRSGDGARLLAVCVQNGIGFELAQTWTFETVREARTKERALKRAGHRHERCPLCRQERNRECERVTA